MGRQNERTGSLRCGHLGDLFLVAASQCLRVGAQRSFCALPRFPPHEISKLTGVKAVWRFRGSWIPPQNPPRQVWDFEAQ